MDKLPRHASSGVVQWRPAVWLAGGASLVLLALLLHERFGEWTSGTAQQGGGGEAGWTAPATLPAPVSAVEPTTAASPTDLATEALTGAGLKVLREDPADIFAPAGAVRHYGLRRKTPDGAADIVAYTVEADIAEVENFYRTRLAEEGYKLTQRRPGMQPGSVSLLFLPDLPSDALRGGQQSYCVTMRPADKTDKNVKIVLVVARPGR